MNDPFLTPADWRRAGALLTHAAAGDAAGMAAVWQDVIAADALPELAAAQLTLFLELTPALRTPEGVAALRELTADMARAEADAGVDERSGDAVDG